MNTKTLNRVCDHTFYIDNNDALSVVVDLGMNKGEFTKWMLNNTSAHCYGVEPVPELYTSLPRGDRVTARQVAIGGRPGTQTLVVPERSCASLAGIGLVEGNKNVDVEVTTLRMFLSDHSINVVDILKIDIEGAEIAVLQAIEDEVFYRIRQMTIEFHDFVRPSDRPVVAELIRKLQRKGIFRD